MPPAEAHCRGNAPFGEVGQIAWLASQPSGNFAGTPRWTGSTDGWASSSSGMPARATTMQACRCREVEHAQAASLQVEGGRVAAAGERVQHDHHVELAPLQAVRGVGHHVGHAELCREHALHGGGLVPVRCADRDARRCHWERRHRPFGQSLRAALQEAGGQRGARAHRFAVCPQRVPRGQFVQRPARLGRRFQSEIKSICPERPRAIPQPPFPWRRGGREAGEGVEGLRHHRRGGSREAPGHREGVHREPRVVVEEHRDRAGHRIPGQAHPAFGRHGGERVELARVADEQGLREEPSDSQQQVRTHLVRLVHDRPRPGRGSVTVAHLAAVASTTGQSARSETALSGRTFCAGRPVPGARSLGRSAGRLAGPGAPRRAGR